MDVPTRGSLGTCIAVRVGEVLSTLKTMGVESTLTRANIEQSQLKGSSRRSQQKFLHSRSTDQSVSHACRGTGGNTQNQRCVIIRQESVGEEIVSSIQQGYSVGNSTFIVAMATVVMGDTVFKVSRPIVINCLRLFVVVLYCYHGNGSNGGMCTDYQGHTYVRTTIRMLCWYSLRLDTDMPHHHEAICCCPLLPWRW